MRKAAPLRGRRAYLLPGLIGIEPGHARHALHRVVAKVLLVDRAGMIDHEGHHARIAVFGGPGEQCKAADHFTSDDVVERAARRVRALLSENPKVIAVIRHTTRADLVAFG